MEIFLTILSIGFFLLWFELKKTKSRIKCLERKQQIMQEQLEMATLLVTDNKVEDKQSTVIDDHVDMLEEDQTPLNKNQPLQPDSTVASPLQSAAANVPKKLPDSQEPPATATEYTNQQLKGDKGLQSNQQVAKTRPVLMQQYQRDDVKVTRPLQQQFQTADDSPVTPPQKAIPSSRRFQPDTPNLIEKGLTYAKSWLTTGNIPVKIGMLVLFFAVIAFLRYATVQGWLHIRMEYRLIGVAVGALGALAFAWTKRESKRSFSLSVQGGSIGILLLVIFSAVKMYGFITPTIGFLLSVMAVLLASALALKQDAKMLIIMAIFAGFLAPIWLSDGTGSHVILFAYYAILNVGIFIVSWCKPWRELNLLGFIFTYGIGSLWGGLKYTPEHFASIEPFVALFFLFYLLIPLRDAQRASQDYLTDKVSASLLFGAPLVTLGLQVGLLYNDSTGLAYSCVVMGMIYAVLTVILRGRQAYETLHLAYMGLSAGFLTLAVPIGLSAKATSAIFALEGAGAVWLGCRTRRTLTWVSGIVLQIVSAISYWFAYRDYGLLVDVPFLINEWYLSALLIIIAAGVCVGACYYYAKRGLDDTDSVLNEWLNEALLLTASTVAFLWGLAWWLFTGIAEITRVSSSAMDVLLFTTLTATGLVAVYRYFSQAIVMRVQAVLMMLGGLVAAIGAFEAFTVSYFRVVYPLTTWDVTVWSIYAALGWLIWRDVRRKKEWLVDVSVTTWLLSLATIFSLVIYQVLPSGLSPSWFVWSISVIWLILMTILVFKPQWLNRLAVRPTRNWRVWTSYCVLVVLTMTCLWGVQWPGGSSILWVPIVNSVDSLVLITAGLILAWAMRYQTNAFSIFAYTMSALIISSMTARMMHHWGGLSVWKGQANGNWSDWWQLLMLGFWGAVLLAIYRFSQQIESDNGLKKLLHNIAPALSNCLMVFLVGAWFTLLLDGGNVSPLPWLPVLNPLSVLQWGILVLMWRWLRDNSEVLPVPHQAMIIPALGLILISVMTLRFVHHWGDITWSPTMLKFALTQMALTLVWSVLGVVSWISGSRRGSRPLWLMGAMLMSVVLVKLILIDRGHLGNLFGILSFFAYGLLCVIVGYFAPMPPANAEDVSE